MASATAPAGSNGSANAVRQSNRQTRTNPSRVSKTAGRNSQNIISSSSMMAGGLHSQYHRHLGNNTATSATNANIATTPHGIYPGITHFTDTLVAIPREFRRHESLLKEVDGKSWALEERLPALVSTAAKEVMNPAIMGIRPGEESMHPSKTAASQSESSEVASRRQLFQNIRNTLSDILPTMDEKNHVARNANKELKKQMQRLDTAYSFVKGEVSEESRLGNLNHWAYSNKTLAKATGTVSERPRRETAAMREQNALAADDSRREAVGTRKQRRAQVDPDGEDGRSRKGQMGAKGKGDDQNAVAAAGSATAASGSAKRRKVEKPQTGPTSAPMERSASTNTTTGGRSGNKDAAGSTDTTKRRNNRAPNATTTTTQRKRTNTVTSTAGSPQIPASPLVPALGSVAKGASPAPNTSNRPQPSRTQPSSIQTASNGRQRPPSSASNRAPKKVASGTHKDQTGSKSGLTSAGSVNGDNRPASLASSKSLETKLNREEVAGSYNDIHITKPEGIHATDAAVSVAPAKGGRSSKTSTPAVSTFAESQQQQQRSRPLRSTEGAAAKRSHKKGASSLSAARQLAAAAAAAEDEDSSRHGDDEDDEGEPRYCYCNQVSFGDMVACDNDSCPREWFHLSCVGLTKPPLKSVKWYCNECKDMKKSRSGNTK